MKTFDNMLEHPLSFDHQVIKQVISRSRLLTKYIAPTYQDTFSMIYYLLSWTMTYISRIQISIVLTCLIKLMKPGGNLYWMQRQLPQGVNVLAILLAQWVKILDPIDYLDSLPDSVTNQLSVIVCAFSFTITLRMTVTCI